MQQIYAKILHVPKIIRKSFINEKEVWEIEKIQGGDIIAVFRASCTC
jgi:hypothetical protein